MVMGHLKLDFRLRELKENIVNLLRQIGINLASRNIWIVADNPSLRYAILYFPTAEDYDLCFEALTEHQDLYDLSNIVECGKRLVVTRKHNHANNNDILRLENTENGLLRPLFQETAPNNDANIPQRDYRERSSITRACNSGALAPSSSELNASVCSSSNNAHMLSATANIRKLPLHLTQSSPMSDTVLVYRGANAHGHVDPNKFSHFKYVIGNKLGNETRIIEFKCGQGLYIHRTLIQHVTKYMCAFLNSEGGVLVIGVQDDGMNSISTFRRPPTCR